MRSPTTNWRQEQVAENAREISELGKSLYERIRTLSGHFGMVGRNLAQAVDATTGPWARWRGAGAAGAEEIQGVRGGGGGGDRVVGGGGQGCGGWGRWGRGRSSGSVFCGVACNLTTRRTLCISNSLIYVIASPLKKATRDATS
jgi:hypothetical protein